MDSERTSRTLADARVRFGHTTYGVQPNPCVDSLLALPCGSIRFGHTTYGVQPNPCVDSLLALPCGSNPAPLVRYRPSLRTPHPKPLSRKVYSSLDERITTPRFNSYNQSQSSRWMWV
ncbi:hypothetical protein RSAG8_12092, partial [Rhizoctonia solani AG-8 WAC10335]